MGVSLPEWSTGEVLTEAKLRQLIDCLRWMRARQPHTIDINGNIPTSGQVCISGYVQIDPATYPGYVGYGERYGIFELDFPSGLLSSLRTLRLQPQYGTNQALIATVSNETVDGVLVTVCDAGGSAIEDPFGLWVEATGVAGTDVIPSNPLVADFYPPNLGHPLSSHWLNRIGQSIAYQHGSIPYLVNTDGTEWESSYGIGEVVGYLLVNPAEYPNYVGYGEAYGMYHVDLPSGILSQLIGLEVQIASGANGALLATTSEADQTGFDVFVYDSGETPIQVHTLWIRARGLLASGQLPVTPEDRDFNLPYVSASTELTAELLNSYSDCCHYRLRRTACLFNLDGEMLSDGAGYGVLEGYVYVDPYSYIHGYAAAGARYGIYPIIFPEGVFEEVFYIGLQPASSSNTWMSASISDEKPGGCTVFVWDVGGTPIVGHAQWLTVVGRLKEGMLP